MTRGQRRRRAGAPNPIIAAHMYPVITMGEGAHPGSRDKLLGANPVTGGGRRLVAGKACGGGYGAVLHLPGHR